MVANNEEKVWGFNKIATLIFLLVALISGLFSLFTFLNNDSKDILKLSEEVKNLKEKNDYFEFKMSNIEEDLKEQIKEDIKDRTRITTIEIQYGYILEKLNKIDVKLESMGK